jgi:hypothetical protein
MLVHRVLLSCETIESRCIWVLVGGVDEGSAVVIFVVGEDLDRLNAAVPTVGGEEADVGVSTIIREEGTEPDEGVTLAAAAPEEDREVYHHFL